MPTTRVSRLRELQVEERHVLDALVDGSMVGHIGFLADGVPVVIPTAVAREGDELFVHGSTGSGWMRGVAEGAPACVAVTALDGVIVARSVFESSLRYRSAVVFGSFQRLEGDRKERALSAIVDKLIPGRSGEVRPSTEAELRKTMVLAMPIATWSLKVSSGWPDDAPDDVEGPAWAGVVPLMVVGGPPLPAPDLHEGIDVPPSVLGLSGALDSDR